MQQLKAPKVISIKTADKNNDCTTLPVVQFQLRTIEEIDFQILRINFFVSVQDMIQLCERNPN